jgi:hypothetical protein
MFNRLESAQLSFSAPLQKVFLGLVNFLLLFILLFSAFYLTHSYDYLAQWYLKLNDRIAYLEIWKTDFFNEATRAAGIWIAGAAIIISGTLFTLCTRKLLKPSRPVRLTISYADLLTAGLLMLVSGIAGIWAFRLTEIGADEIYSAVYCAGIHPLQTVSYYMDTNNHLFFNIVNNIFFHLAGDKLFAGRLISWITYLLLTGTLYLWIKTLVKTRWAAALMTMTLMLQFPVLGFAVQNRGYEVYLFCQWLSFISLFKYQQSASKRFLILHITANVIGLYTIPTYLYFLLTVLMAGAVFQLYIRRFDLRFWAYQCLSGIFVFLLYVPVFLFSGIRSVTSNKHVKPSSSFNIDLYGNFRSFIHECFWDYELNRLPFYAILFLLPLLVFILQKGRERKILLISYLVLWPGYILVSVVMRHYGFMRNLIAQESISLFMVLIALYWLFDRMAVKVRRPILIGGFALIATLQLVHFVRLFPTHVDYYLYLISTNHHNSMVKRELKTFPQNASIACPNFALVWYYFGQPEKLDLRTHVTGNEDFIILHHWDTYKLPASYKLYREIYFYKVYKNEHSLR